MWTWIIGIFTGPFGNIARYVVTGLTVTAIFAGLYFHWENKIRQEALAAYNQKQLEQIIQDQQLYITQTKQLQDQLDQINSALNSQTQQLNDKVDGINQYLASPEAAKTDRPSSEIIKETVRRLRK